jgi:hypothetical protein
MMESTPKIAKHVDGSGAWYVVTLDPRALKPLAKAIADGGREVDGYVAEAILIKLSEIGDSPWADELSFDSEVDACTVRCARRLPLVHPLRRFERRLTEPTRLQRLVKSLPE